MKQYLRVMESTITIIQIQFALLERS